MSVKIYVCDDEPKFNSDISQMVSQLVSDSVISEFLSGKGLLAEMNKNSCDILLLDIDMPEISGLDIAAHLTASLTIPVKSKQYNIS